MRFIPAWSYMGYSAVMLFALWEIPQESSDDEEHFMGEAATIGELSEEDYTIELSVNNRHVAVFFYINLKFRMNYNRGKCQNGLENQ